MELPEHQEPKSNVVELSKPWKRKIDRIRKTTPFRFDPLPTLISEEWLPLLSGPELKCVLYICRRTWGFRKEWDAITIEQFMTGIVTQNGKRLDSGTGLGETCVRSTLRRLESKHLIDINRRNTKAHLDRLNVSRGSLAGEPQLPPQP